MPLMQGDKCPKHGIIVKRGTQDCARCRKLRRLARAGK